MARTSVVRLEPARRSRTSGVAKIDASKSRSTEPCRSLNCCEGITIPTETEPSEKGISHHQPSGVVTMTMSPPAGPSPRLKEGVAPAPTELAGKERVAAGGIHDHLRIHRSWLAFPLEEHLHAARPLAGCAEKHFGHVRLLEDGRSGLPRVVEEESVELGPLHLGRARVVAVDAVREQNRAGEGRSLVVKAGPALDLEPRRLQL